MSYTQEPSCNLTETDLTEPLVPEYLSSLRWTSTYVPNLIAHGKHVKHGQAINGKLFSELLAVKSRPCELRLAWQEKFYKNFIDFGLIQTALEKIEPTHNHEHSPEIAELLVYLEANKDSLLHRCRYWTTELNEIRSVFFATKQMIRMFKEYGQLLVVDATYNLTNFTLKLLIFTIRTGTCSYNIAAVALIAEESEDDIQ